MNTDHIKKRIRHIVGRVALSNVITERDIELARAAKTMNLRSKTEMIKNKSTKGVTMFDYYRPYCITDCLLDIIDDIPLPLYVLCVLLVLPCAYIVDTIFLLFTAVITPFVVLLRVFQFFVITIKKKLEEVGYKKKCEYLKCSDSDREKKKTEER